MFEKYFEIKYFLRFFGIEVLTGVIGFLVWVLRFIFRLSSHLAQLPQSIEVGFVIGVAIVALMTLISFSGILIGKQSNDIDVLKEKKTFFTGLLVVVASLIILAVVAVIIA